MPRTLPTILLALLPLSVLLTLSTLATASRTLALFNAQQPHNPWLLPLWRGHFDLRGLQLVVAASAATLVLDGAALAVLFLCIRKAQKTALKIVLSASSLSALLALPAAILPLVLNGRAPGRDTLQSWTCGWVAHGDSREVPGGFGRVCGESRFAAYAPLGMFAVHFVICGVVVVTLRRVESGLERRGEDDGEKMVELGSVEGVSVSVRGKE